MYNAGDEVPTTHVLELSQQHPHVKHSEKTEARSVPRTQHVHRDDEEKTFFWIIVTVMPMA